MNIWEYNKVKDFSYEDYCAYLSSKYFNQSKDGLFKHHTKENLVANLCDPDVQKYVPLEFRDDITYCSFDEHLLLHILIGEQTDVRKALGLGGAVNYIIPQLKNYFDFGICDYPEKYYSNLSIEVFNALLVRCEKVLNDRTIIFEHNKCLYLQMEWLLNNKNKALVVLGTCLGKTTTALEYLWRHKCRALVIAPNNTIVKGWSEYASWCDVTTYQSFSNTYQCIDYSKYGLVIIDEAHHAGYEEGCGYGAKVWGTSIKWLFDSGIKVMGLTATPQRGDGIDVGALFNNCVCKGLTVEDAIEDGIIYPFSYITSLYNVRNACQPYLKCSNNKLVGQLNLAINNTPTTKNILNKYMPNGPRKGIVFIQNIDDEQYATNILKEAFPHTEIRSLHVGMDKRQVEQNREWFENTREGYIVTINMLTEGAHYEGVNTLIMFRRTDSYVVFMQQLGRIITLTKNQNPNGIVFDFVNNIDNITYDKRKQVLQPMISSRLVKVLVAIAKKSDQIIVADETREVVNCIRKIKSHDAEDWEDWEIDILEKYFKTEGPEGVSRRISNERNRLYGI